MKLYMVNRKGKVRMGIGFHITSYRLITFYILHKFKKNMENGKLFQQLDVTSCGTCIVFTNKYKYKITAIIISKKQNVNSITLFVIGKYLYILTIYIYIYIRNTQM